MSIEHLDALIHAPKRLAAMAMLCAADWVESSFLRDKLGFPATDVGGGWLIFNPPEADLGVHPTDDKGGPGSGTADLSFYCDDIVETVKELRSRGVEFTRDVEVPR